jgi:hypothetical protein
VYNKGMETIPFKRFRRCFNKHLRDVAIHTQRFIECRGTANHFSKFDTEMMKKCIELKVTMDSFLDDYRNWLLSNTSNPEKYLDTRI